MNTMLKTGAVAAALIGAIAMTMTPGEARSRHHHRGGAAAAGFVGGLAVGAIAANSYNNRYYGPGYGYGYYEPGYAYYGGPGYYDSYAYAPAPRYRTYNYNGSSYRPGTYGDSLMNR